MELPAQLPDAPVSDAEGRLERIRRCLDCRQVRRAIKDCESLRIGGRGGSRVRRHKPGKSCRVAQKQTKVYGSKGAPEPLVPNCATWDDQMIGAARAEHPTQGWAEDLGAPLHAAVRHVAAALAAEDGCVARERAWAIKRIRAVKKTLASVNIAIEAHIPEHIRGMKQRLDVALFHVLSTAAGSPDVDIAAQMAVGFEAVGDIAESGWWPREEKPALASLDEMDHAAWHKRMEASIRTEASQPWRADDVEAVWRKTLDERDRGLMHGPFSQEELTERYGVGAWRAMQRFGIWQKGKLRACDNARTSMHNDATACHEKMVLEGADFPARVALAFYEAATELGLPMWAMRSGTDDLADAYRHIPTRSPQYTVVALWSPTEKEVRYFTLPGFNFGLKSAVPQFNRVAETTTLIANEIVGVVCCHFFDDYNVTEPTETAASGQGALWQLHLMLGLPFSQAKHVPAADLVVFLGVQTDLSRVQADGTVTMCVTEERIQKLGDRCESILVEDSMMPSVAASLVGKLQFTLSWAFGRLGRAALQPLHAEMVVHREGWVGGARVRLVNRRAAGFEWRPSDVDITGSGGLANPFSTAQGDTREAVCDAYQSMVIEGGDAEGVRQRLGLRATPARHGGLVPALRALKKKVARGRPFRLVGASLPRRCHGLTLLQHIGAAPRRTPGTLTEGQRASLRFFADVLPELKPHVVRLWGEARRPALVFSDARYEEDDPSGAPAAVGFVVGIPHDDAPREAPAVGEELAFLAEHYTWSHGSAYVPDEIMEMLILRKQQIGQAELLGAVVPYLSMPKELAGRDVLHWIDNTSAKAALVHGYSGKPDSARIVHLFHAWNMGLGARVWFEYVPSKANPSDEPSRVDMSQQRFRICEHPEIVSEPLPLIFPPVERWSDPAGWAREAASLRAAVAEAEAGWSRA